MELVIAIGKGGANIRPENALAHIYGYAVGLDMTRRDLQAAMKTQVALGKLARHLIFLHQLVRFALLPIMWATFRQPKFA